MSEPAVWMQSDHLYKFKYRACGSQSMLARCSDHKLQSDYAPLYSQDAVAELVEALKGVLRVADRQTDEFDAAHAAVDKYDTSLIYPLK